MKKIILGASLIASIIMLSCSKNGTHATKPSDTEAEVELRETIAHQDSLLVIMNDIADNITRLKEVEGIMNQPGFNYRSPEQKAQVLADIAAIQSELEARRTKLSELEQKYNDAQHENVILQKAIVNLKARIEEQEKTVSSLRGSLADANSRIESLNQNIIHLNEVVDSVTSVSIEKDNVVTSLNNELNTVYYAFGNKNELKSHKLIETGFLRKTKVLPEDFEMAYFTPADKRTLSEMPLMSKKAKIITNQPKDTYEIYENNNGLKVLKITDPDKFWAVSNFLIIQID